MFRVAGIVLLLLATLGVVLPVLPTTPFVLLAAWCFAKSSPRMHQWLLSHRLFGPVIQQWEDKRCVSRKTKWIAICSMLFLGALPVLLWVKVLAIKLFALFLMAIGAAVVLRLPTCDNV